MNTKTIISRVAITIILCTCGFFLYNYSYLIRSFIFRSSSETKKFSSSVFNKESVQEALYQVQDLELGISIVDLGLVRNVEIKEDKSVEVTIIFTAPFCPYADFMIAAIKKNFRKIEKIKDVKVEVDLQEIWQPAMMTVKGRAELEGLIR